jgi:hypothetical protein
LTFRRLTLVPLAAALGVLAALAVALPSFAHTTARPGKLTVGVQVLRFRAQGRKLTATGFVTARLSDNGKVNVVHTKVAVAAAAGKKCTVLYLYLNQLNLQLLGLTAHLDKLQLSLTGNPNGGVLGSLFCKLARARVTTARASAVHQINQRWSGGRQDIVRFTAAVAPKFESDATTGTTCQVLSLVLGPLQLQLLGLEVNLNKVTLTVTATRGGGALGDLFCQLADENPATTSTTSSSTATTTPATTTSATTTTTTG